MKKRLLGSRMLALIIAAAWLLAAHASVPAQDKAAKIDELMKVYNSYRQFNGTVLVAENGKVIFKKGYGLANMEWNIPVEPDTKFRLGSITKQFTSMLVLELVQEGKIKLEGKLTDYLPDYRKDTGDRITIHQLLNHTSGIPSYTGMPNFFQDVSRNPYGVSDFVKKFASGDLEFEPGTKWNYNNSGYFLLGAIVERVTGKPYEQVLKERILDPVGMKDTGYDHYETILAKRASGYEKRPGGYVNAPYLDMSLPYAAGSLYSTVGDLYLWDQALYTDKLLSPQLKESMFKPGLSNYAYGWVVQKGPLGAQGEPVTIIQHGGGINGFNTLITRLPESKNLIVLLNSTGGTKLQDMSQKIAAILFGKPYKAPLRDIADTIFDTIMEKDVQTAIKQYRDLKATQQDAYDFGEQQLNGVGYRLLQTKRIKDAIEVFKLNVEMFPQGFNTYDSLGEAYMANGDKSLAIQNYKKSLELNPKNTSAVEMLKKLEAAP
ncbi:MAG TPA: serine hydrolase [Blastocatellia bacterium]|nr:serine hydrolase [Blastocatellia bacterium]